MATTLGFAASRRSVSRSSAPTSLASCGCMPTVANTFTNRWASATASLLLDMSPAPPTATIFSTPAARARSITASASPAYSLPWMWAWLSISMTRRLFLRVGFDARKEVFRWIDFMPSDKALAPGRLEGGRRDGEQGAQLPSGGRHERRKSSCKRTNNFEQVMQHFPDSRSLICLFNHAERRRLHYVTVSLIECPPYGLKRPVELQAFGKLFGIKIRTIDIVAEYTII